MNMLEVFPTGDFDIEKIDRKGLHFNYDGATICIPHSLIAFNSCTKCAHFNYKNKDANTCKAFRDKIPDIIFLGKDDHKTPFSGDGGIQFRKR